MMFANGPPRIKAITVGAAVYLLGGSVFGFDLGLLSILWLFRPRYLIGGEWNLPLIETTVHEWEPVAASLGAFLTFALPIAAGYAVTTFSPRRSIRSGGFICLGITLFGYVVSAFFRDSATTMTSFCIGVLSATLGGGGVAYIRILPDRRVPQ